MLIPPKAISNSEFLRLLKKCTPPTGWPSKIAVANSGGPDSTCLLFLLKRAISGIFGPEDQIPLVSLSVDHKLQDSSSAMSARAEATAKSLGVQHITSSVQWGTHPFPPKPTSHTALERRARDVRYHILFRDMVQAGAGAVAFGHHADDQIELCLMRMARSSTEIGAAGMRYCRRWGMGHSEGQLAWAGYEGMSRWIIRPMLGFTKDRILATCDEHALEYAVDQTNFQPELTIRNSIRHLLAGNLDIPLPRQKEIDAIQQGAARLNVDNLRSPAARVRLYSILEMFGEQREYIDEQVTSELSRLLVPSPPSTIAFPTEALGKITDPVVLAQLLMRIIRYVSARPWGSVKSEAGRSSSSITGIINGLLATDPFPYTPSPSRMKRRLLDSRKRFSGGSDVLWEPVAINARGGIRYSSGSKFGEGERPGWLAMRLKPMLGNDALTIDITKPVQDALGIQPGPSSARSKEEVHILWDNRFVVRIHPHRMPSHLCRLLASSLPAATMAIEADSEKYCSKWYLPKVTLRCAGAEELQPSTSARDQVDDAQTLARMRPTFSQPFLQPQTERAIKISAPAKPRTLESDCDWVSFEFIRPLDAL